MRLIRALLVTAAAISSLVLGYLAFGQLNGLSDLFFRSIFVTQVSDLLLVGGIIVQLAQSRFSQGYLGQKLSSKLVWAAPVFGFVIFAYNGLNFWLSTLTPPMPPRPHPEYAAALLPLVLGLLLGAIATASREKPLGTLSEQALKVRE